MPSTLALEMGNLLKQPQGPCTRILIGPCVLAPQLFSLGGRGVSFFGVNSLHHQG